MGEKVTATPEEFRTMNLAGRDIKFKPLGPFQIGMVMRTFKALEAKVDDKNQKTSEEELKRAFMRGAGLIESAIVEDDDREWLIDKVSDGTIGEDELMGAFRAAISSEPTNRVAKRTASRAKRAK